MRAAIAPRAAFEEIWARDFADNLWEMPRHHWIGRGESADRLGAAAGEPMIDGAPV